MQYDEPMNATIRLGTSGYSFKDWVGTVYPPATPPGQYLRFYAGLFDAVEINTTYYRVPRPSLFERMLAVVDPGFLFVVKLPKEATHDRERFDAVRGPFLDAMRPLQRAGQLGGLLAQFPTSFRPSPQADDHLARIADAYGGAAPVSVEFRHAAWQRDETYERLERLGLGIVNVDLPAFPTLPTPTALATTDVGYVRLHGRNRATWWRHPKPSLRYDYLYSTEELKPWAGRIRAVAAQTKTCFAFTNNCHLGQSVVNALQLGRFLEIAPPQPPAALFAPSVEERIDALRRAISSAKTAAPNT